MRVLTHLPYRVARRRDAKAIAGLLEIAGMTPDAPLGAALADLLGQRTQDCRDLFALRGVRTRRETVLVMAGRALAKDAQASARLDDATAGQGLALLSAISLLIDRSLAPHLPRPAKALAAPVLPQPAAPPEMCEITPFPTFIEPRIEAPWRPERLAA